MGYPAIHHSNIFRENYKPSYRVISNRYIPFLNLLIEIDKRMENKEVVLCIEGGSASGKSTLGDMLSSIYDSTLLHMDDFFLQPHQRSQERLNEIGGNIDYERFLNEVLIPLKEGEEINYRRFDCSKMMICEGISIKPKRLTIIKGAYSMHPLFEEYYDLKVFLDISSKLQKSEF
jgi:uridine kinase